VIVEGLCVEAHNHILFLLEEGHHVGTQGKLLFKNGYQLVI
jgi:hypothetical protein